MQSFLAPIRALSAAGVDFMIVGGVAGVLHGAPITTHDLDILYSLRPPNPERLLEVLNGLDAVFRADTRKLRPNLSHMITTGHKLFTTRFGDLDCLGSIEDHTIFEDLLEHTDELEIDGLRVLVISLPRLIEVKRKLTRPKDRLALMQLEATLSERTKSD